MVDVSLISQCPSAAGAPATRGTYPVCSDTRQYKEPSLFLAFPGARHNPLEAIGPLLRNGCPAVVFESGPVNEAIVAPLRAAHPQTTFIPVADVVTFTQELGTAHVRAWQRGERRVFAISGSNGKTTHKEMLAFLLEAVLGDRVVATEKNYNNHLGVPLTLLRITPQTEVCVLELGSNHPGEIKVLCDIARPSAGLVTNIGATHLEFFGDESKVFEEEGYLFHAINQTTQGKGLFFQNLDDPYLARLSRSEGTETFSRGEGADYQITPTPEGVKVAGLAHVELVNLALTGAHNKQNMAVAWMIARRLFPAHEKAFTQAAQNFRPTRNRSEWMEHEGKKIFLDAYNANPSSMQTALEGFFDWMSVRGHKDSDAAVVLGDMNELGDGAPDYHRQVGQYLRRWPAARVAFVGRYAAFYQEGLGGGEAFADAQALKGSEWVRFTEGRGHIFVKGSRSLQLESLVAIT